MTIAILYITTFVVFLGIDYFGLGYVVKPLFDKEIGDLMLEDIRILPAFVFYAFYAAVLLWFVSYPALVQDKSLLWVLGNGALIGAMAYGTYEFTSYAIMKDWTLQMVATDVIWGSFLTALSAGAGVAITRAVT